MTDSRRMPNGSSTNNNTEHPGSRFLEHDATLVVDDDVSLTLGSDSLVIVGMLTLPRACYAGRNK